MRRPTLRSIRGCRDPASITKLKGTVKLVAPERCRMMASRDEALSPWRLRYGSRRVYGVLLVNSVRPTSTGYRAMALSEGISV
jgi:hypothetical protein